MRVGELYIYRSQFIWLVIGINDSRSRSGKLGSGGLMTHGRFHYDRATGDSTTTALPNRGWGMDLGPGDLGAHGRFHYNRVAGDSTPTRYEIGGMGINWHAGRFHSNRVAGDSTTTASMISPSVARLW